MSFLAFPGNLKGEEGRPIIRRRVHQAIHLWNFPWLPCQRDCHKEAGQHAHRVRIDAAETPTAEVLLSYGLYRVIVSPLLQMSS